MFKRRTYSILVVSSFLYFPQIAFSVTLDGSTFNLVSKASSKCADLQTPSLEMGSPVIHASCDQDTSQQWKFVPAGSSKYQIVSKLNGKCFDVSGSSLLDGAEVKASTCIPNKANQLWTIVQKSDGYSEIVSVHSNKCLNSPKYRSDNQLIQRTCVSSYERDRESWSLKSVGTTPPPTASPTPRPSPTATPSPKPSPAPSPTPSSSPSSNPTLKSSPPLVIDSKRDLVISGLRISNPNGPCILVRGSTNITITNSELGPCKSPAVVPSDLSKLGSGVFITGSTSVTVDHLNVHDTDYSGITIFYGSGFSVTNNDLRNIGENAIKAQGTANVNIRNNVVNIAGSGVSVAGTQRVKVDNNRISHMKGSPRANFVQFNRVSGAGNSISCNIGEQDSYGTPNSTDSTEDEISLYNSTGLSNDPILVVGNKVKGGGPSKTGGGIMLGDGGGSYITARDNVVVNPGGYGMAISGGTNMKIINNQIYSVLTPFSSTWAIPVWNYNQSTVICNNAEVQGNRVNWMSAYGSVQRVDNLGTCANTYLNDNKFADSSITPRAFDDYVSPECPIR